MSGSSLTGLSLYDAHCHIYDADLSNALKQQGVQVALSSISAHVINGTHPDNWQTVADYAGTGNSRVLKAYGVHPWNVDNLPGDWELQLRCFLGKGASSVGEIGLDSWIKPRDDDLQRSVFVRQLEIACEYQLPPSIHCVRAYGALLDILRSTKLPERGFLAHGFAGSREILFQILDLNGYVSFSAYGADPGRKRIRDAIRACPPDRLLIETDAPHMVPPKEICAYPLKDDSGNRLHHPAELLTAYKWISELREMELPHLVEQVRMNFKRFFESD